MSITFYVTDWEKQESSEQKVFLKDLYPDIEKDYWEMCAGGDPLIHLDEETGDYYENRVVFENPFPELNMCNRNAEAIIKALEIPFDYSGEISFDDLSKHIRTAVLILNSDSRAEQHTRDREVTMHVDHENAELRPRFVSFGIDAEYVKERLTELRDLFKFAKDNGKSVYWG